MLPSLRQRVKQILPVQEWRLPHEKCCGEMIHYGGKRPALEICRRAQSQHSSPKSLPPPKMGVHSEGLCLNMIHNPRRKFENTCHERLYSWLPLSNLLQLSACLSRESGGLQCRRQRDP